MGIYKNIFDITHNNLYPSQGSILISEPTLDDLYFHRSVVFLVEHNKKGSMGLVLNKKTQLFINDFFDELEGVKPMPIYLGGPMSPNRLFFIHSLGEAIVSDTIKVGEDLYFDGDFDSLKKYIADGRPVEGKVKFFLGYSGWTEGQLGKEIKGESWVVSKSKGESILCAEGDSYWKSSLAQLGEHYKSWINYPKDPHLN